MGEPEQGQYLIISELTQKAYIDEKRNAYLLLYKEAAKEYTEKIKRTTFVDLSEFAFPEICSYVFASGAMYLIVCGQEKREEFKLERKKLRNKYYNANLHANLARYLHTKDLRYLRALSHSYFIVPIRIKNSPDASISYATARIKNRPYVYVAFTDLEEYYKWDEVVAGWQPLEVDAAGFKRIGEKHGYLINPFGRNVLITKEMMRHIKVEEEESEER